MSLGVCVNRSFERMLVTPAAFRAVPHYSPPVAPKAHLARPFPPHHRSMAQPDRSPLVLLDVARAPSLSPARPSLLDRAGPVRRSSTALGPLASSCAPPPPRPPTAPSLEPTMQARPSSAAQSATRQFSREVADRLDGCHPRPPRALSDLTPAAITTSPSQPGGHVPARVTVRELTIAVCPRCRPRGLDSTLPTLGILYGHVRLDPAPITTRPRPLVPTPSSPSLQRRCMRSTGEHLGSPPAPPSSTSRPLRAASSLRPEHRFPVRSDPRSAQLCRAALPSLVDRLDRCAPARAPATTSGGGLRLPQAGLSADT